MEFSSPLPVVPTEYKDAYELSRSCTIEVLPVLVQRRSAPGCSGACSCSVGNLVCTELAHSLTAEPGDFHLCISKAVVCRGTCWRAGTERRANADHGSQRGNGRADGNDRGFDWQADRQASRGRPVFSRGQEAQALANAGCVPTRRARHASVESSAIPLRAPVLTGLSACRAWLALVTCEHVCSDAHGVADRRRWKKCWT